MKKNIENGHERNNEQSDLKSAESAARLFSNIFLTFDSVIVLLKIKTFAVIRLRT